MEVESFTVESTEGVKLHTKLFKPSSPASPLVVVLVHPYTVLGGCQALLRGLASRLAATGHTSITFDMRGAGRSSGKASLTGASEVSDVVSVCRWASDSLRPEGIVLVGSSAGSPIAGSAVDKIDKVIGYVSIGYPFGIMSSILFGSHHSAILQSPKPKVFIMGTKDGFTSVKQLKNKLKSAIGNPQVHLIEGVGHFELEGPSYDGQMADLISNFISSLER